MGAVAVLRPQDVLKEGVNYRQNFVHTKSRRNSISNHESTSGTNPNANPSLSQNRNNRRKRSPQKSGSGSANLSTSPPAKNCNLVMGQVKILKRGEPLTGASPLLKENKVSGDVVPEDLVLSTTDRLGPEPDMVPKQIRIVDFYAGSVISSPPPSSLPVPAFFKRKSDLNDDATSDLRRLLRLDLCCEM